jgi:hypothetical protein
VARPKKRGNAAPVNRSVIGESAAREAQWSVVIDASTLSKDSPMRVFRQYAVLVALALGAQNVAQAQFGGQIGSYTRPRTNSNPTVSPYLNLNRAGSNPAINYYGLVRPQMDTNRSFQQLDPALFGGDPRMGFGGAGVGPDGTPIVGMNNLYPNQALGLQTGHPATYFYYSHYFQFPQAGQRGGGAGAGGNSAIGRPNTQATPFFAGNNGMLMPVNPSGANPLGGPFGTNQPLAPGMVVMP